MKFQHFAVRGIMADLGLSSKSPASAKETPNSPKAVRSAPPHYRARNVSGTYYRSVLKVTESENQIDLSQGCCFALILLLPTPPDFSLTGLHLIRYLSSVTHFTLSSMGSNSLKIYANRAPLEEETNALQEAIKRDKSIVGYLKYQYDEQKSALEANERMTSAFRHSTEGITSLQQATKQLLQSIEHLHTTFISILPSQQHPEVASRIPGTDQFVVDWQVALDCLSNVPEIMEQRLSATTGRVHANQMELAAHDSLRAQATQAVDRMGAIVCDLNHSIEYKRLGVLHPIRRVPCEILKEIFEYAVDQEHAEWMDRELCQRFRVYPPSVAFHISATSRHWREIATRTPKLWRYIYAPWSEHRLFGRTRFLRCLELAGGSGLVLILLGKELVCWKPILTGECTKQWSSITIVDPKTLPSRLPMSSRLNIYSTHDGSTKIDLPSHLTSSLVVMSCSMFIPQFTTPATKLTTLYLNFTCNRRPYPDLGVLFNSLPSLSQLTLDGGQCYIPNPAENRIFRVHDTLEVLSITPQVLPYLTYELQFISIPSLSVMKIRDLHYTFTERQILRLFKEANSIKDTVTDLYISSSKVVSNNEGISTLIRSFSQLKRLELHGFAVTPGLEALLETGTGSSLMQTVVKDYPEGNEKLREIIDAAGPKASWTISY